LAVFGDLIHYGTFHSDGIGVPSLDKFSTVIEAFARLSFILLLILLAKGWTISTDEIRQRGLILAVMSLLSISYFTLIIVDFAARDPASTVYEYESVPGGLIVALNGLTGIWFAVTIYFSYSAEEDVMKKSFYMRLGLSYTIWFGALPFLVIIGIALDPWVREKIVTSLTLTVTTIAYTILAYLLWPSRAEVYFKIKTPDIVKSTHYEQL